MSNIKQLIWESRKTHLGGVPKFAWYLQRAVGGEIYAIREGGKFDFNGCLGVADGNLCQYLTETPIISVVHGTWKEYALRNGNPDFTNGEIISQHTQWNRPGVYCVCVSHSAARQLFQHHGRIADEIIYNCVDTEVYVPVKHRNTTPVVIYCANDANKRGDRISELSSRLMGKFEFRYLNAKQGEEHEKFAQGDLYIHPSNYEGCSLALLEAMSCNLPVVGTKCGLLEDIDESVIGGIVPWDTDIDTLEKKLLEVYENRAAYNPRNWILENASFELFKERWSAYLQKFL